MNKEELIRKYLVFKSNNNFIEMGKIKAELKDRYNVGEEEIGLLGLSSSLGINDLFSGLNKNKED